MVAGSCLNGSGCLIRAAQVSWNTTIRTAAAMGTWCPTQLSRIFAAKMKCLAVVISRRISAMRKSPPVRTHG